MKLEGGYVAAGLVILRGMGSTENCGWGRGRSGCGSESSGWCSTKGRQSGGREARW